VIFFSFAVYPTGTDFVHPAPGEGAFDPFVLDVPKLPLDGSLAATRLAQEAAARRAWWSAFSHLRLEPEEFVVYELKADGTNGRLVGSGGFVKEHETAWTGGWPA
jgi:hypothetical protein